MLDVFEEVKGRLTMDQVARNYGLEPDRAGFCRCPFHAGDRTASLKLYPGGRGWHCFGCNRGGSVIDFVSEMFHMSPLEAVRQLDRDFGLHLPLDRQQTPAERREAEQAAQRRREITDLYQQFETWRHTLCVQACEAYRVAHMAIQRIERPEDITRLSEQEQEAIRWQSWYEYLADALTNGEPEEIKEIFKMREEVQLRLDRILKKLPQKSLTA